MTQNVAVRRPETRLWAEPRRVRGFAGRTSGLTVKLAAEGDRCKYFSSVKKRPVSVEFVVSCKRDMFSIRRRSEEVASNGTAELLRVSRAIRESKTWTKNVDRGRFAACTLWCCPTFARWTSAGV